MCCLRRMACKEKFTVEIQKLAVKGGRLKEKLVVQVVLGYKEVLRTKEKAVAVVVDNDNFQSVLLVEAWSVVDTAALSKEVISRVGKVISIENAKVASKGKSLTWHTRSLKVSFDVHTVVKEVEDSGKLPKVLPTIALGDISMLTNTCLVSVIAAIHEAGTMTEPEVSPGMKKPVTNLRISLHDKAMSAAFWGPELASCMSGASVGEVYRIDWIMAVPEGVNNVKLSSTTGTSVRKLEGAEADTVRTGLAACPTSMSAVYRKSRQEKLDEEVSRANLSLVEHMAKADVQQDAYKGTVMVPGCFVRDVHGISAESGVAFYKGCSRCRKMLTAYHGGTRLECEKHGEDAGQPVYCVQVSLQELFWRQVSVTHVDTFVSLTS